MTRRQTETRTALLLGASALVLGALAVYGAQRLRATPAPRRIMRSAGPHSMVNPPRQWSLVDERSGQSFPASDPPGTY